MAKLSYRQRENLSSSEYAMPSEKKYPIPDIAHARNALARVKQFGTSAEKIAVREAVYRKFPQLKPGKK